MQHFKGFHNFGFLMHFDIYLCKLYLIEWFLSSSSYEYEEGHRVLGKPDKSDIWYTGK